MQMVYPDYYPTFRCIADACRHSCCVGWEIDIDDDTLAYYDTIDGAFGERLRTAIARDDTPHFIIDEQERCPFLNNDGLCDIILELGDEALCDICASHPRFHNELPDRLEIGLGLCCEEAARLVLSWRDPVRLCGYTPTDTVRDRAIAAMQDRSKPIAARMRELLSLCDTTLEEDPLSLAARLLRLERLDETWTQYLQTLQTNWATADVCGFDTVMASREAEYEQVIVYLLYRHLTIADDPAACVRFVAAAYTILHEMGAVLWTTDGAFSFEQHVELVRLFSSEIEYSEENLAEMMR